jgi:DHA1 family quinolone resistance protein-like MFS transporter
MGMARALSSGCMDAYFVDAFDALEMPGELQRFLARVGVFVPLSLAAGGLLGSAAWGVAFAGLEQFWQPYVDGFTMSESPTRLFGYLATGYFLVGSLGALASSRLFLAIGTRYGATVGALRFAMGALFVLLSFTGKVPLFAAVYLALFFLNGVNDSPEQAMFNARVPSSARSTLLSFQSLFLQLGGGMAAFV